MPYLFIDCPNTGTPLFTGYVMSRTEYRKQWSSDVKRSIFCYHCSEFHLWQKNDSYLKG